jgi:hypothetical protein
MATEGLFTLQSFREKVPRLFIQKRPVSVPKLWMSLRREKSLSPAEN